MYGKLEAGWDSSGRVGYIKEPAGMMPAGFSVQMTHVAVVS